jgi:hypothetical protein
MLYIQYIHVSMRSGILCQKYLRSSVIIVGTGGVDRAERRLFCNEGDIQRFSTIIPRIYHRGKRGGTVLIGPVVSSLIHFPGKYHNPVPLIRNTHRQVFLVNEIDIYGISDN